MKLVEFIRDGDQHRATWLSYENGLLRHEDIFGLNGSNYGRYFFKRFPELTTVLYILFQKSDDHGSKLPEFYKSNKTSCFSQL